MIMYVIYSALVLALLYLVYFVFLRQVTFHRMNRISLLSILVFSLLLPALPHSMDFSVLEKSASNIGILTEPVTTGPKIDLNNGEVSEQLQQTTHWSWKEIAGVIYISGVLGLFCLFIYSTLLLILYLKDGLRQTDRQNNTLILIPGCRSPFSFMKYIVMSVEDYELHQTPILMHEQEHIRQYHSLDLILLTVVQVIQWFNPFVWMLGRDLKVVHEYEADKAMQNYGVDIKDYQHLLVDKSNGTSAFAMVNGFNHSQLISRIIMLNKKRSKPRAKGRYLVFAPMLLLSYMLTAQPVEKEEAVIAFKDIEVTKVLPEFPEGYSSMKSYLNENLKYPEGCDKEGTVIVQFVVDVDGSIKQPVVVRSIDELLDAEAIRLVKSMPNWRPGAQNGHLEMSKYTLPIGFVNPNRKSGEKKKAESTIMDKTVFKLQGTVIDAETKEPIIGAAIIVVGTTKGVVTSNTGEFSLEIELGQRIKALMPDYKTSETDILEEKIITIPLTRE